MPATSGRVGLVLPLSLPHPRPCESNPAWRQPRLKRMMDLGADGVSTRHVPAGHQISFRNSGLKLAQLCSLSLAASCASAVYVQVSQALQP